MSFASFRRFWAVAAADTPEGGSGRRRGFCCMGQPLAECDFNLAALHPAYPIKRRTSAERTQASQLVDTRKSLSPLTH